MFSLRPWPLAIVTMASALVFLLQGCGGDDGHGHGDGDYLLTYECEGSCVVNYECHGDHVDALQEGCAVNPSSPSGSCEAFTEAWDGKTAEERECEEAQVCCDASTSAPNACAKKDSIACGGGTIPTFSCEGGCSIEYECHGDHIDVVASGCSSTPVAPSGDCAAFQVVWDGMTAEEKQCYEADVCCSSSSSAPQACATDQSFACSDLSLPDHECVGGCHLHYECHGDHLHIHSHDCDTTPSDPPGTCTAFAQAWASKTDSEKECERAEVCCQSTTLDSDACTMDQSFACSDLSLPDYSCEDGCHLHYECHGDHIHIHSHDCNSTPADPSGTCTAFATAWAGKTVSEQECEEANLCCASSLAAPTACAKAGSSDCSSVRVVV